MQNFLKFLGVLAIFSAKISLVFGISPLQNTFGSFDLGSRDFSEKSASLRAIIEPKFRLPNQIIPRHCNLEIRPIINEGEEGQFTAPGKVQITVECLEETSSLVLHAAELNITESSVKVS